MILAVSTLLSHVLMQSFSEGYHGDAALDLGGPSLSAEAREGVDQQGIHFCRKLFRLQPHDTDITNRTIKMHHFMTGDCKNARNSSRAQSAM